MLQVLEWLILSLVANLVTTRADSEAATILYSQMMHTYSRDHLLSLHHKIYLDKDWEIFPEAIVWKSFKTSSTLHEIQDGRTNYEIQNQ